MRRGTAWALVLIAALALAAAAVSGCGGESAREKAARAAAVARARAQARQVRLVAAGRPVFVKHCASCHTIEGHTAHPTFIESPIPNLDEVKPRVEYVGTRVETGGFDMPSIKQELKEGELEAVVAYVAEASGRNIVLPRVEASVLAQGEQVFRQNCQRCHGIAGRRRTSEPTFPGTEFNFVRPSERLVIHQVLSGIREEMPSFRGKLSSAQIHAVAAYVTATAGR